MNNDTLIGLDPCALTREVLERQYDAMLDKARDMQVESERALAAGEATLRALDPFYQD